MNARLRVVVTVASTALLLVSTVGVAAATTDVVSDSDGSIELAPHSSDNGDKYASIEDGELVMTLDGLPDDAVTRADEVFMITATGDRAVTVWIEHDDEATTFYQGTDTSNTLDDGGSVTLDPGETVDVGLVVDTRVSDAGPDSITVHAEFEEDSTDSADSGDSTDSDDDTATDDSSGSDSSSDTGGSSGSGGSSGTGDSPVTDEPSNEPDDSSDEDDSTGGTGDSEETDDESADIRVVSLSVGDNRLSVGETTTVRAPVENIGSATGAETIELLVDGISVDSQPVTLDAGASRTITFDRTFQRPGEKTVRVGPHTQTIVVEEPTEPAPLYKVTDVSVSPTVVGAGDPVTITATLENAGSQGGTFTAELATDGAVTATASTFVPAGETATITFERTFQSGGVRSIAVSGVEGATVYVRPAVPLEDRILAPSQTQAAGVSVAALAALLAWRRNPREQLASFVHSKL